MIGKGVFRENFQPHSCSGKKAPRTGQVKGNFKNIITIDSDEVDDVVILDFDEFLQQHGSSVPSRDRVCTPQSVISIDDDDDESDDAEHPGNIAEGVGESDSASSSKKFTPAPSCMQNFVHIDVDDSHVSENDFVSDMQKSRQTCSAKATGRNRYGLDRSESESSESDCSDCELLEVREQWEKASIKRKRHVFNNQFSHDQHASSSRFPSNIYSDIEVENTAKQYSGSPVYSGPRNGKYVKESQSSFSVKADSQVKGIYSNLGAENPFKDSDKKDDQESSKSCRPESMEKMQSLHRSSDIEHGECTKSKEFVPCSKYTYYNFCNFCSGVTGASMSKEELGDMESKTTRLSQKACERQVDNNGSALRSKDDNLSEMRTLDSNCASFDERHVNCDGAVLHAQDGGFTASNQKDIINEREKLKETDEYKRVIEEEWASRQLQLQIQAEEAQRLRKRKKAEAQRLLDMQRRQKERIEEVRETQKKDEEFMNMKEQLRVEIQRGLNKLEKQCRDMASLLRGLGIHVGGGFIPLPDEVRAAYKRALLKFHPDRASKTDIREQVEAEEKFKLISRMKDRISLTLCR